MIPRPFWTARIENAWRHVSLVWLAGVRRCGKTTLAKSLDEHAHYVNCDLPSVEDMLRDPEIFYRNCDRPIVIFDEVHQLTDPSRVLKIGTDLFPELRLLATGSSTLVAGAKFRDALTGRKRIVHLLPVLWDELEAFGATLTRRLFHGGLPPALLANRKEPALYREWLDSFYARDIQRLFSFRNVDKFNHVFEYILKQSGGMVDNSKISSALGISRPTIESHLRALETTHGVTLLRPFFGSGQKELVKMPKCYGFDTGFVSYCRGWDPLRQDDMGYLWEHLVLESLQAHCSDEKIHYWRDAAGHEIDFVIPRARDRVDVYESKWNTQDFDPASLKVFRTYYPRGTNFIVVPANHAPYLRRLGDLEVWICNPGNWNQLPTKSARKRRVRKPARSR